MQPLFQRLLVCPCCRTSNPMFTTAFSISVLYETLIICKVIQQVVLLHVILVCFSAFLKRVHFWILYIKLKTYLKTIKMICLFEEDVNCTFYTAICLQLDLPVMLYSTWSYITGCKNSKCYGW